MKNMNRRDFGKLLASAGVAAAVSQLSMTSAFAGADDDYRAMVGVFLYGGNDSWNMIVPTDQRYTGYAVSRGTDIALAVSALLPMTGTAFGMHPALALLKPIRDAGAMAGVLNTGTLYQPLNRSLFLSRPDLRPTNLFSHSDEEAHWQGLRARGTAVDGFLGRINDKLPQGKLAPVMSVNGSDLIVLGQSASPIMLPIGNTPTRTGASAAKVTTAAGAREAAMVAMSQAPATEVMTNRTADMIAASYAATPTLNSAITNAPGNTDACFVDTDGTPLTSDIAKQLMVVARMIASRGALGQSRQAFFAGHDGYDTHAAQTGTTAAVGIHCDLLTELSLALAGFYAAMKSLGVDKNVTLFTMSDFGRTFKGNLSHGTDHGWGGNQIVIGGGLKPRMVHGAYPNTTLGGPDDSDTFGRFIPTIAQEEYIGAIARWHGVASADMGYVFPNWATWSGNGRGLVPMFT